MWSTWESSWSQSGRDLNLVLQILSSSPATILFLGGTLGCFRSRSSRIRIGTAAGASGLSCCLPNHQVILFIMPTASDLLIRTFLLNCFLGQEGEKVSVRPSPTR